MGTTERKVVKEGASAERTDRRSSSLRVISDFSAYPSSHLTADDQFLTSDLGKLLLDDKRAIQPYGQLAEILDLKLITALLREFLEKKSFSDAVGQLPGTFNADAFKAAQNTMWLYKYGYLESR